MSVPSFSSSPLPASSPAATAAGVTSPSEGFAALHQFTLYESRTLMVIVGADKTGHSCRLLTFDRTSPYELRVSEDPVTYSRPAAESQAATLIAQSGSPLERTMQLAAILGFIRLPKVFMVCVVAREKVGSIGGRWIYTITDWKLKAIGHKSFDSKRPAAVSKYKSMIMDDIELNKDFYFSYFYDVTHTLQHNLLGWKKEEQELREKRKREEAAATAAQKAAQKANNSQQATNKPSQPTSVAFPPVPAEEEIFDPMAFDPIANDIPQQRRRTLSTLAPPPQPTTSSGTQDKKNANMQSVTEEDDLQPSSLLERPRSDSTSLGGDPFAAPAPNKMPSLPPLPIAMDDEKKASAEKAPSPTTSDMFFQGGYPASASAPNSTPTMPDPASNYHPCYAEKWLWNLHLAREFLHYIPHGSYWLVPLIHGFVQQHAVRIGRKDVLVTLIARRSRHFAGTRYIKRGVSSLGHVANEVESEQIIQERYSFSEGTGAFSSIVMLRGSIPLYFAQENPKSFKPDIVVYNFDRDFVSTKAHFADCFKRYGSPVSVLSLIKKEEKYPQETRLGMAFNHAIQRVSAQFRMDEISAQLAAAPEPAGQSREQAARDEMLRIQEKLAREGNTPFPGASAATASSMPASSATTPNIPASSPPSNSILSSLRFYSGNEPSKSEEKAAPVSDRVYARNPPPYNHPSYDPHSILYCTYDFLGMRAKQANVLRDLKSLVSNLVDEISVFTWVARPAVIPESNLLSANSTKLQVRDQEGVETKAVESASASSVADEDASVVSLQKGILRVNCIDCLDRTNVGQFCIGKAALKIQLKQLGIFAEGDNNNATGGMTSPSPYSIASPTNSSSLSSEVYPELIAILQDMYTQHGDRIAHQYAGSGAMHKEILYGDENTGMETEVTIAELEGGKKREKALPTNITQNAFSAIKRYYSNNFSDQDKQCAINVFLGNYIPNLITHKPPIWELDVYTNLMDSDQLYAKDGERFRVPWVPQAIGAIPRSGKTQKLSKRLAQAVGVGASKLTAEAIGDASNSTSLVPSSAAAAALAHNNRLRFQQYFSEQYNPTKVTSFDDELKRTFQAPVVVKSASGLIETLFSDRTSSSSNTSVSMSTVPSTTASARESSATLSVPGASASSSISPSPPAAASASPSLNASSSNAASLPSINESGWEEVSVSKSNQPSASSSPVLAPKGASAASGAGAIPPLEKRKTNPLKKGFTSLFSSAKASFTAVLKSDQAVQRQQQQQVAPPVAVAVSNNSSVVTPAKRETVAVTPAKAKAAIPVAAIVSQTPEVPPPAGTVGVTSLSSLMHQTQSQSSNGLAPSSLSRESSQFSPSHSSSGSGDMSYPSQFLAASTSSAMYTGWSPRITEKKTIPFRVPRLSNATLSLDGDLPSIGLLTSDSAPGSATGSAVVPAPIAPTSLELDRLAIHPDYLHSAAQDQYALERYAEYCDTNRLFDAQPLNFTVPFSQFETVAAAEAQTLGVRVLAAQAARHTNAAESETSSALSEAALLTNSIKMSHHQLVDLLVSNLHDIESLQTDLFASVEKQQLGHLSPKEYKAAAPVLIAPLPPAADPATRKQQNDAELRAFLEKTSS